MLAYYVDEQSAESIKAMRDFADGLLDRLERGQPAPAAETAGPVPDLGPTPADRALEVLYEDGTERLGSLWFLEAALRFPAGQGYTLAEIAQALDVEPAEARAYRRNLGRAIESAVRPVVPNVPEFFGDRWDARAAAYRYEVRPEIRAAAERKGLVSPP
jgi:hypothetical protein